MTFLRDLLTQNVVLVMSLSLDTARPCKSSFCQLRLSDGMGSKSQICILISVSQGLCKSIEVVLRTVRLYFY